MNRYSSGAILLHWLIAFLLAFELALGFAMPKDSSGFTLFQLHKSIGITILVLTVIRLIWRLTHARPKPLESGITNFLAQAVHVGFYLFMVLAPLTGWALVSTAPLKIPTILFGVVPLPHLPLDTAINEATEQAHVLLAWFGIALFVLHVAGALRHEFLLRHRLLERMAPGGSQRLAMGLAGGVILLGAAAFASIGTSRPDRATNEQVASTAPVEAVETEAPAPVASATPTDEPSEEASEEPAEPGPPPSWTIRPGGRLGFSVGSDGWGQFTGTFSKWSGNIVFDPERPETADIRITIDLASASVGDATQDGMLAGEEFFSVGSYGRAVFTSRDVRATGPGRYSARGTLQLKGSSRPQSLTFTLTGQGLQRKVQGNATVSRTAFGVGGASAEGIDADVAVNFSFDADGKVPAR